MPPAGRSGSGMEGLIVPAPSTLASRADLAAVVNVVQPVGCSTLTTAARPASLMGGLTVTG